MLHQVICLRQRDRLAHSERYSHFGSTAQEYVTTDTVEHLCELHVWIGLENDLGLCMSEYLYSKSQHIWSMCAQ